MLMRAALGIGMVFLFIPNTALACSCVTPGTPVEEMKKREVVFAGEVKRISKAEDWQYVTTFEITKAFKGVANGVTSIKIYADPAGPSCGIEFDVGEKYIVYASTYEGKLQTNRCTRTRKLSAAAEDLKALE